MKDAYVLIAGILVVVAIVATAGFRGHHFTSPPFELFPDMNYQGKVKDQVPSTFFSDGNAARPPVPGTIALEMPSANDYWATGKWDETHWGDGIPAHEARDGGRPLTTNLDDMARGRERYNISCAVCHGAAGDGKGIVSKYGITTAASYHQDRLRTMSDGEIFDTITNGRGQMLGYGYNIAIDDRWRIIMYIRALQRSQNAPFADASADEQQQLMAKAKPAAPEPAHTAPEPVAPTPGAAPVPAATPAPAPAPAAPPKSAALLPKSGNWIAINTITSSAPTQILGPIQTSGRGYILNQNGIIFGSPLAIPPRFIADNGMTSPTYYYDFAGKTSNKRIKTDRHSLGDYPLDESF